MAIDFLFPQKMEFFNRISIKQTLELVVLNEIQCSQKQHGVVNWH